VKTESHTNLVTRDIILKLLSDNEEIGAARGDATMKLASGEQYIDLERLDRGVQYADVTITLRGRIVPRNGIHAPTWDAIMNELQGIEPIDKY
jgi:hypothetical protein